MSRTISGDINPGIINVESINDNTLPQGPGEIVTTTAEQSLEAKTLVSPIINNSGIITLPTGTRTLVARDTSDTLTNKLLVDNSCYFRDGTDNTKQVGFFTAGKSSFSVSTFVVSGGSQFITVPQGNITLADLSSIQTLSNKTLTNPVISSISNTGTLTLPNSTDTLIGRNTIDTLTNKTLSSPAFSGTSTGAYTHSGLLTFSTGIRLPTAGGTPSDFTYYETGSFTITLSGIWASNRTGTVNFTRCGNLVSLRFPDLFAATNANAVVTVSGIPLRLCPASLSGFFVRVYNNGAIVNSPGFMDLNSIGGGFLYLTPAGGAFTNQPAAAGLTAQMVSYLIN